MSNHKTAQSPYARSKVRGWGEDSCYLFAERGERGVFWRGNVSACAERRARRHTGSPSVSLRLLKHGLRVKERGEFCVVLMKVAAFFRESASLLKTTAEARREPGKLSPEQWVASHVVKWIRGKSVECGFFSVLRTCLMKICEMSVQWILNCRRKSDVTP